MLDDRLPADEVPLVRRHVAGCRECARITAFEREMVMIETVDHVRIPDAIERLGAGPTRTMRVSLAAVGLFIVAWSVPAYVRGNTNGDVLHDLRHLSIWQVAVGVACLTGALSFRFSRMIAIMATTFLFLTALATGYDVVTGHRGPWTDPVHIIEVVALVVILRMSWPHVTLSARHART